MTCMTILEAIEERGLHLPPNRFSVVASSLRTSTSRRFNGSKPRSGGDGRSASEDLHDVLAMAKNVAFLMVVAKMAFGKDKSYVSHAEWFPKSAAGDDIRHREPDYPGEAEGVKTRHRREKKAK